MESKQLTALIVDDEKTVLEAMRVVLLSMGYKIGGTGEDGREAVELARTTPADFIILDVAMPVMDGLAAARIIAAENPLPIIVSTGITDDGLVDEARQIPVQAFLSKPFRKEQLRASIGIALSQWELQRETERKLRELTETNGTPRIADDAAKRFGLTRREAQVLRYIAEGKSNAEIGETIGAATRTVDKHVEHIFGKLAVKTRTAAVARALHLAA